MQNSGSFNQERCCPHLSDGVRSHVHIPNTLTFQMLFGIIETSYH